MNDNQLLHTLDGAVAVAEGHVAAQNQVVRKLQKRRWDATIAFRTLLHLEQTADLLCDHREIVVTRLERIRRDSRDEDRTSSAT